MVSQNQHLIFSLLFFIILVPDIAGTLHPIPRINGIKELPDKPINLITLFVRTSPSQNKDILSLTSRQYRKGVITSVQDGGTFCPLQSAMTVAGTLRSRSRLEHPLPEA